MTSGSARLVALAALAFSAGCSPAEADRDFTLLYSTLGYEVDGSKRALVRSLADGEGVPIDLAGSRWQLLDDSGDIAATGPLRPRGVTFGARLWEIDFSTWTRAGADYRLRVGLALEGDRASLDLESQPFPIESRLYSRRLARGLSVHNAEVRHAPASMGGGYFDCNSRMGEATSHAMFAAGLVELLRRRGDALPPDERVRLLAEIHRALDYVIARHDEATGEITNQHPSRPGGNPGAFNTQLGVYGLSSYLTLGAAADPARAAAAERRVRSSFAYLEARGELYPELGAAVYAHLHAHTGSSEDLEAGARYVEAQIGAFEPRTGFRHPQRTIPWFEGVARLAPGLTGDRRQRWTLWARGVAESLVSVAGRNAYGIVPPLGKEEWDDPGLVPVSPVEHAFYTNLPFLTLSIDAVWLGELLDDLDDLGDLDDPTLERLAASGLQWVSGVDPGIPAEFVTNPEASRDEPPVLAASFVVNGPGRYARPWQPDDERMGELTQWWWTAFGAAPRALTVTNGFVAPTGRGLLYDPAEWQTAETYILTDGLLLRAILLYEDSLRPVR